MQQKEQTINKSLQREQPQQPKTQKKERHFPQESTILTHQPKDTIDVDRSLHHHHAPLVHCQICHNLKNPLPKRTGKHHVHHSEPKRLSNSMVLDRSKHCLRIQLPPKLINNHHTISHYEPSCPLNNRPARTITYRPVHTECKAIRPVSVNHYATTTRAPIRFTHHTNHHIQAPNYSFINTPVKEIPTSSNIDHLKYAPISRFHLSDPTQHSLVDHFNPEDLKSIRGSSKKKRLSLFRDYNNMSPILRNGRLLDAR